MNVAARFVAAALLTRLVGFFATDFLARLLVGFFLIGFVIGAADNDPLSGISQPYYLSALTNDRVHPRVAMTRHVRVADRLVEFSQ